MERATPLHSTEEIVLALHAVTSESHARALLSRALRVAGVRRRPSLEVDELLLLCAALAAEGGHIEQIAADLARRALHAPTRDRGRPPRL